ncbi:MAG: cyclomaltodextrinase C-terminal domain-containing protein, partial [Bacteroidota bacterium]
VYFRYNEDQKLMVILNKNETEVELDLSRFSDMLDGDETAKDVLSGASYSLNAQLRLPAAKPLILEID